MTRLKTSWSKPVLGMVIFLGYILTMVLMGSLDVFTKSSSKIAINGILGLFMGYVLQRGFFGFAGTAARTSKGNPKLAYAVLGMFGVVAIIVALLASTNSGGEFYKAVIGHSRPVGLGTVLGATIFGMGMILSKGCASGALTDMSSGSLRVAVVLVFFVLGAGPGQMLQGVFNENNLQYQEMKSLPGYISGSKTSINAAGWVIGVLLTLIMLISLGLVAYFVARKMRSLRNVKLDDLSVAMDETPDKYTEWLKMSKLEKSSDSSSKTQFRKLYFNTFVNKLPLALTSAIFGGLLVAIIVLNSKGWGVTTSFARMFDWIFNISEKHDGLPKGKQLTILSDSGTWRNFGLVIGAVSYMLMANKFKLVKTWFGFRSWQTWRVYGTAAIGGLMLGFGARLADGCNAGQWTTGITTFSLSGWIFGAFMIVGAAIILWLATRKGVKKVLDV